MLGAVYFEEPLKDQYTDASGGVQNRMKNVYLPACHRPQKLIKQCVTAAASFVSLHPAPHLLLKCLFINKIDFSSSTPEAVHRRCN